MSFNKVNKLVNDEIMEDIKIEFLSMVDCRGESKNIINYILILL